MWALGPLPISVLHPSEDFAVDLDPHGGQLLLRVPKEASVVAQQAPLESSEICFKHQSIRQKVVVFVE